MVSRYAYDILELDELNRRLKKHIDAVQKYSGELSAEQGLGSADTSLETKLSCENEAREMYEQRTKSLKYTVQNEEMASLITKLSATLLQLKVCSSGGSGSSSTLNSMLCFVTAPPVVFYLHYC